MKNHVQSITLVCWLALTSTALAQPFDLSWSTIDGGGGASAGGAFALSGTIGQPDASPFTAPMTGESFEVVGGFWPATFPSCACIGDMNGDGVKDGRDIQLFVSCVLAGGSCACADADGMSGVTIDDLHVFVADLLEGPACP